MRQYYIIFHPIVVFIASLLALIFSLILFIHWNVTLTNNLELFTSKFPLNQSIITNPSSWAIILIFSVLIGVIMVGMALLFIYYQKSNQLYLMQENFINSMTHELKTPIASIKLYLETFLRHELAKDDQHKFIQFMLKDTQRLSNHVQQILQVARLENKNTQYALVRENAQTLISNFYANNGHLFNGLFIKVEDACEGKIPLLLVNKDLIETLLMNIASNSEKYNFSNPKKLTIVIKIKRQRVYITFDDNGIGVSDRLKKKIFDKFFRIENYREHQIKGTGLGLYLCSQIAKIHSGEILAENLLEGNGLRITLSLPDVSSRFKDGLVVV